MQETCPIPPSFCPSCGKPIGPNQLRACGCSARSPAQRAGPRSYGKSETVGYHLSEGTYVDDRFKLRRLLGEGGMGTVWLAEDSRLASSGQMEIVALKFLRPQIAHNPAALALLRKEVAVARGLSHPHIVSLHDMYLVEGQVPFISMEFVDGPSLARLLKSRKEGRFVWNEAAPWILQLCEALNYLHRQGLVHRDIKAGNLLLSNSGLLKVADFGLITAFEQLEGIQPQAVASNGIRGTPVYMSPQHMDGLAPHPADDIYSFGATVYEILSGTPAFKGSGIRELKIHKETESSSEAHERMTQIRLKAREVPSEFLMLIARCLARDPGARPRSFHEIIRQLQKIGITSEAARTSTPTQQATPELQNGEMPVSENVNVHPTQSSAADETITVELATGMRILNGRFELLEQVRRELRTDLWLARDCELSRDGEQIAVSLWFVPGAGADSKYQDRIRKAVALSRRLRHVNILAVHEILQATSRQIILCTEPIRGGTIEEILHKGQFALQGWSQWSELIHQLFNGMEVLHQQGLTLGKVDPARLWVTSEGSLKLITIPVDSKSHPDDESSESECMRTLDSESYEADLAFLGSFMHWLLVDVALDNHGECLSRPPPNISEMAGETPAFVRELIDDLLIPSRAGHPKSLQEIRNRLGYRGGELPTDFQPAPGTQPNLEESSTLPDWRTPVNFLTALFAMLGFGLWILYLLTVVRVYAPGLAWGVSGVATIIVAGLLRAREQVNSRPVIGSSHKEIPQGVTALLVVVLLHVLARWGVYSLDAHSSIEVRLSKESHANLRFDIRGQNTPRLSGWITTSQLLTNLPSGKYTVSILHSSTYRRNSVRKWNELDEWNVIFKDVVTIQKRERRRLTVNLEYTRLGTWTPVQVLAPSAGVVERLDAYDDAPHSLQKPFEDFWRVSNAAKPALYYWDRVWPGPHTYFFILDGKTNSIRIETQPGVTNTVDFR